MPGFPPHGYYSGELPKIVISASALEKIETFARSNKLIVAAYVFGSAAAGRERPQSDIDVALMIRGSMDGFARVQLETTLSNLLGKDIDLVIFGRASPLLQHQILKYGRIVYESDPVERVRQEVASRWEYLDSLVLYRIIEKD
ncbi:MAG: nucleotidyltransferase domain-containing protein [Syntrophobacteraceae bacterium]